MVCSARLAGLSWHPCFPQAGAPGDAREQPARRSPHRCRRRGGKSATMSVRSSPDASQSDRRGTVGVRVFTVDDGWGWIFTAIEHWNAECVGWRCVQARHRFAALQRRSPWGLRGCMPGRPPPVRARAPALQMDHGSQYLSDHFTIRSSSGASSRPTPCRTAPATASARRFNRTLKEQIIHGRSLRRNIARGDGTPSVGIVEQFTCPVIVEQERLLPAPLKLVRRGTPRCTQARRKTNLCPRKSDVRLTISRPPSRASTCPHRGNAKHDVLRQRSPHPAQR